MPNLVTGFTLALDKLRGYPLPKSQSDLRVEAIWQRQAELHDQRERLMAREAAIAKRHEARLAKLEALIAEIDLEDERLCDEWTAIRYPEVSN